MILGLEKQVQVECKEGGEIFDGKMFPGLPFVVKSLGSGQAGESRGPTGVKSIYISLPSVFLKTEVEKSRKRLILGRLGMQW